MGELNGCDSSEYLDFGCDVSEWDFLLLDLLSSLRLNGSE